MNRWLWCAFTGVALFCSAIAFSQTKMKKHDSVTCYVHVIPNWFGRQQKGWEKVLSFVLKNTDTLGQINWQSGKITAFIKDDNEYFLKLNTPPSIPQNSSGLWCTAIMQTLSKNKKKLYDTLELNCGGAHLGKIKLNLKSTPEDAAVFLIPSGIWAEKFEKSNWEKDSTIIEKFRVNTSTTDTYAYIDETEFVVLYKKNSRYKKTVCYTRPAIVAKEQTLWLKLD